MSRKASLAAASIAVVATSAIFLFSAIRHGGATHASAALELLSRIPPGAPTLAYLDLTAVRESGFYRHRPDRSPIAVLDPDYAEFVRATGFNFETDLDRVVVASWPGASPQDQRRNIAVAEGRFDRSKIRDYAARNGKLDRQDGREVLRFPKRQGPGWVSLVFLDDRRIAVVDGSSIAPVLTGPFEDPADPVRERAARVEGAAAFVITRAPDVPDNFAAEGLQSTQLARLARSLEWVTLAARPEGDDLRVSLEGECRTSADAGQLQSALEALRVVGEAVLENPKTRQQMDPSTFAVVDELLKTADIKATDERVRILMELTPEVLKLGGPKKQ